jgi:hypothetical protein
MERLGGPRSVESRRPRHYDSACGVLLHAGGVGTDFPEGSMLKQASAADQRHAGVIRLPPKSSAPSAADAAPSQPPLPPLVLRVGVTGHRPSDKRPEPDVQKLRAAAQRIFQQIADTFAGVAATYAQVFACADTPPAKGGLRVISALAAGADQWLADEALKLGYELQAPLPLPREEYRKDFAGDAASEAEYDRLLAMATAVLELDGKVHLDAQGHRHVDPASYEAVGFAVLDQSDLLIAVWDGQRQRPGGTGQVVHEAVRRGIPVIWIRWAEAGHWDLMSPSWQLVQKAEDLDNNNEELALLVRALLLPPHYKLSEHVGPAHSLREAFFCEPQKSGNPLLGLWLLFRDFVTGEIFKAWKKWRNLSPFRVASFEESTRQRWEEETRPAQAAAAGQPSTSEADLRAANRFTEPFVRHYAWANELSVYYANLYRSSFVLTFLLGFLAVCCGLSGPAIPEILQVIGGFAELALIGVILMLTYAGRWRNWHERWIDYRTLAERIRLARFLALFGGGGQQVAVSGHLAGYGNPVGTWMHWHYRAIERAAGLPSLKFDQPYLAMCQRIWCDVLVLEQMEYHELTHRRLARLDRRLHGVAMACFWLGVAICIVHLVMRHFTDLDDALMIFAGLLPALAAALGGICSQGEFHRVARRSAAMASRLEDLRLEMASVPTRPGELNSVRLSHYARKVAQLMINEMLDWRVVFQDRPLGLPA